MLQNYKKKKGLYKNIEVKFMRPLACADLQFNFPTIQKQSKDFCFGFQFLSSI